MPTPQNGQTQSNNSLAFTNSLSVFDHFVGLALKGLNILLPLVLVLVFYWHDTKRTVPAYGKKKIPFQYTAMDNKINE